MFNTIIIENFFEELNITYVFNLDGAIDNIQLNFT